MEQRFDELLHTVVAERGEGIQGFFDTVFSFLYRKTDFFYEMAPGENMGFFPGQSQAMIGAYFKKYQELHFKQRVPKRDISQEDVQNFIKAQREKKETPTKETEKVPETEEKQVEKKEEKQEEEKVELEIPAYNGDKTEQYVWSQSVNEVTIQLKIPKEVNKKQVTVKMTRITVEVKILGELFFEGEFGEKINAEDSVWTLDNSSIVFYLEKYSELIWKQAFKGHKEIDTKTVDNSKNLDDFDNDTQAALRKIMYEQNRKRNGLPTTEDEKKLEQLKEAWNKPDSPFKGQPFDPSMFNLNEPIYYNTPDYEASLKEKERRKKEAENNN